jgi:hypothetical protein
VCQKNLYYFALPRLEAACVGYLAYVHVLNQQQNRPPTRQPRPRHTTRSLDHRRSNSWFLISFVSPLSEDTPSRFTNSATGMYDQSTSSSSYAPYSALLAFSECNCRSGEWVDNGLLVRICINGGNISSQQRGRQQESFNIWNNGVGSYYAAHNNPSGECRWRRTVSTRLRHGIWWRPLAMIVLLD